MRCLQKVLLEENNHNNAFDEQKERLSNMKTSLKRVLEQTQAFDAQ